MYHAKQAGRNRVAFAPPLRDMAVDAALTPAPLPGLAAPLAGHHVVLVQSEEAPVSLCLRR
jgi:hypothetical protein